MTAKEVHESAAAAATAWWLERIRGVRPEPPNVMFMMPNSEVYLALSEASMRASEVEAHRPTEDALAKFEAELLRILLEALKTSPAGECVLLRVDYEPMGLLRQAATAAGIHSSQFTEKAGLWVHPDHVLAKPGYGLRPRLAWCAAGWQHPPCASQGWNVDEPKSGPSCARLRWHEGEHDWETPSNSHLWETASPSKGPLL